jgi:3-oxoacyl-[acyl-carrier protein] reductase
MAERARVAVVTGGASGIGLGIVERLVRDGCVGVITDIDEAAGPRETERLAATGARVVFRRMDVTQEADVDAVVPAIAADLGGIDVFVNNAGIQHHAPLEDMGLADWRRVLSVDLDGVFLGTRAAGRVMLGQGSGSIVNIASVSGARGAPGRAPYVVAKAGVSALTQVAAVEWSGRGVRVNAVAPGYIETPLLRSYLDRGMLSEAEILARVPIGRLASVSEIADVVAFLASPAAGYITGQTVVVDGGFLVDYGVASRSSED